MVNSLRIPTEQELQAWAVQFPELLLRWFPKSRSSDGYKDLEVTMTNDYRQWAQAVEAALGRGQILALALRHPTAELVERAAQHERVLQELQARGQRLEIPSGIAPAPEELLEKLEALRARLNSLARYPGG